MTAAAAAAAAAAAEGEGNAKPAGRKPPALNVMPAGAGRGRGRGGDDDEDGSDTLVAGPAKSGSHSVRCDLELACGNATGSVVGWRAGADVGAWWEQNKDTLSLYEFKVGALCYYYVSLCYCQVKVEQHKKVPIYGTATLGCVLMLRMVLSLVPATPYSVLPQRVGLPSCCTISACVVPPCVVLTRPCFVLTQVEYLVLDIRDNLNVFRQALSEQGLEFEDGKGDEIWY
eukprot:1505387-Rhodomonas_salina.1